MSGTTTKLTAPVEEFFADLRRVRASGAATPERSLYGPLGNLLTAVGATLRPKVFCVQELADQGAGHPDFGLYVARQVQRGAELGDAAPMLGRTTFDIYLNRNAFWRNVPGTVWTYKLGGYQVLKKWLSYRERGVLERAPTPQEVLHFTDVARRIAAILAVPSSTLPPALSE